MLTLSSKYKEYPLLATPIETYSFMLIKTSHQISEGSIVTA